MTWDMLPIGDFCRTGSGGTPSRTKASIYFGGNIPWVKSGELREGLITETEETITELAVAESSAKLIPKGALLVAMYGATIGRVAKLGIDATSNQAICHILPDESLADSRYIFHALQAQVPHWLKKGVGGAQPNISQEIIRQTILPLPPLEEQRRIAAILDKRICLEERIQRRNALLDELWKAEFIKKFGNPFSHHSPCPTARLGEITSTSSGGTPKREVRTYFGGNIPWVKSGELSNPVVEATEEFLTEDGLRNSSAKILSPGVVLLAMYGATAGAVSILGLPACTNQAICAIDPGKSIDSLYLADYLRLIAPALLAKRIGGAQPNLTQDIIRNILIPIPSLEEQESYVLFRKRLASAAIAFSRSSIVSSRLGSSCSQTLLL